MPISAETPTRELFVRGALAMGAGLLIYVGFEWGAVWALEPGPLRDAFLESAQDVRGHILLLLISTTCVTCALVGVKRGWSVTRIVTTMVAFTGGIVIVSLVVAVLLMWA